MTDIRHIKPTTYAELVAQAEAFADASPRRGVAEPNRVEAINFHVALGMTPAIKAEQEAARRAYYRSQGWE